MSHEPECPQQLSQGLRRLLPSHATQCICGPLRLAYARGYAAAAEAPEVDQLPGSQLNRWQAMDRAMRIAGHLERHELGSALLLAGITEELAETMTPEAMIAALQVRMSALSAKAGLPYE